jgi:metal-responsive CopG/Arc/MetJ family transcriptional regulator
MEKKITITINADLLKEVDEKAKETLRSRGKFIEFVLREYLREDESIFKRIK